MELKRPYGLVTLVLALCLLWAPVGAQATSSPGSTSEHAAAAKTKKKPAACKRKKDKRKCRHHDERRLPTVALTPENGYKPSGPIGGGATDFLAPWQVGTTLIAGGDCGNDPAEGDHVDLGGRWRDDRYALDFGICGGADYGIRVLAATSGIVRETTRADDYGWTIVIERGDGLATRYAHLAGPPSPHVGDAVTAGQTIGAIGFSGLAGQSKDSAHLHFAAYRGRGEHRGVRIQQVARQEPCSNCKVLARAYAPGQELQPLTQWACPASAFPLPSTLMPGEKHVQPFTTSGTQTLSGYLAINGPYNNFNTAPQARIGIYSTPDPQPGLAVSPEVTVQLRQQAGGNDSSGTSFQFPTPVIAPTGTTLYLIVTAIDEIGYWSNDPATHSCLIGNLQGTQ